MNQTEKNNTLILAVSVFLMVIFYCTGTLALMNDKLISVSPVLFTVAGYFTSIVSTAFTKFLGLKKEDVRETAERFKYETPEVEEILSENDINKVIEEI